MPPHHGTLLPDADPFAAKRAAMREEFSPSSSSSRFQSAATDT